MNNLQQCQSPWSGSGIYIYCCISLLLVVVGFMGMMNAAYNRSETSKRRVYWNSESDETNSTAIQMKSVRRLPQNNCQKLSETFLEKLNIKNLKGRTTMRKNITVQTDGACSGNGQSGARGGYGVHFPGGEARDRSGPLPGARQTNQRAEIHAAKEGIRAAREAGYENITVQTDSAYVKNAMNEWIHDWDRSGRTDIANMEDFRGLQQTMQGAQVRFQHVPREQNTMADRLARDGANKQ